MDESDVANAVLCCVVLPAFEAQTCVTTAPSRHHRISIRRRTTRTHARQEPSAKEEGDDQRGAGGLWKRASQAGTLDHTTAAPTHTSLHHTNNTIPAPVKPHQAKRQPAFFLFLRFLFHDRCIHRQNLTSWLGKSPPPLQDTAKGCAIHGLPLPSFSSSTRKRPATRARPGLAQSHTPMTTK